MKRLFLSLFILLCSTVMMWADNNALIITFNDGQKQAYLLSSLPDITMTGGKMTIIYGSSSAEYDLSTVRTFTFGSATTAIKNIKVGQLEVKGDAIVIPTEKAKVHVYTIDGEAVNAKVHHGNGATTVDVSALPSGRIYIVNADGKSVKILK